MNLTEDEIKAVRYYIGDTTGLGNDSFWSDPKAYVALNALFFPDITAEQARAKEGKFLNPALLDDTERLEHLLNALFSVCHKSALQRPATTYRIERFTDYQIMKQTRKTVSFTSTSTDGFLKAYQDRIGIVLIRFSVPAHTPCIVMKDVLPSYAKAEEAEILLPPDIFLHFEELPFRKEELQITDAEGNPPVLSCHVTVGKPDISSDMPDIPQNGPQAGQRIYLALQSGCLPSQTDILLYTAWKSAFIQQIMSRFYEKINKMRNFY